MSSTRSERSPLVEGGVAGVVAWIVGYALTYLVVAPDVRQSALQRIVEALEGQPATYEMVGWVFFNAHFVNTVFRDLPFLGSQTTSFVGGEDGFTVALYAIPMVTLIVTGLALARFRGVSDPPRGALVGVTVFPGYVLVSLIGVVLFEVSIGSATGGPEFLPAVFLCGVVFPLVFAGGGGALWGRLTE